MGPEISEGHLGFGESKSAYLGLPQAGVRADYTNVRVINGNGLYSHFHNGNEFDDGTINSDKGNCSG